MKREVYIRFAICVLLLVTTITSLFSQDTLKLNEVEIFSTKKSINQIGKKVLEIDSNILSLNKISSIGDLLSTNSSVFIKSYGLGAIASTSFRGGNASQSGVIWNGINIQNAQLAQTDVSILPSFMFNTISVEYSSSSSLWGSGAVGGSVLLGNEIKNNLQVQLGAGSFGLNNQAFNYSRKEKRISFSIKQFHSNSVNNYSYQNKDNATVQLKHSSYDFNHFLLDTKLDLGKNNFINLNAWLSFNYRKLPDFETQNSSAVQQDESHKINLDWVYYKKKYKSNLKTAYLFDKLNYANSEIKIDSRNLVNTAIVEHQNFFNFKNSVLFFGINSTSNFVNTNNYSSSKSFYKLAFLASEQVFLLHKKLILNTSARIEKLSNGLNPFTGNVSADYHGIKHFVFSFNFAKVFRNPSLNELYWYPGGNLNLKPEIGYSGEGNLKFSIQKQKINFETNLSLFDRIINNWILWIPLNNNTSTPSNLQKVWSRGTETNSKIGFKFLKNKVGLNLNTAYILSTPITSIQENSNEINKQLIYTPRYNFNTSIFFERKNILLLYSIQYIGYRFTTSDNTAWLKPYLVSSAKLQYRFEIKKSDFIFNLSCNNLFNQSYQIISARPMPLQNFECSLTLKIK